MAPETSPSLAEPLAERSQSEFLSAASAFIAYVLLHQHGGIGPIFIGIVIAPAAFFCTLALVVFKANGPISCNLHDFRLLAAGQKP